jgi:hypothetical protein
MRPKSPVGRGLTNTRRIGTCASPFGPSMRGTEGNPQGFEQHSFVERLAEVCNSARAHALLTGAGCIVRGYDDDREVRSCTVEYPLHIGTRNAGHLQIEHETVRLIGKPALEKFVAGSEAARGMPGGLK